MQLTNWIQMACQSLYVYACGIIVLLFFNSTDILLLSNLWVKW